MKYNTKDIKWIIGMLNLTVIMCLDGCASAPRIKELTVKPKINREIVYEVVYIEPSQPLIFVTGTGYELIFKMSEPLSLCRAKIGKMEINFEPDRDNVTWTAKFEFPSDSSLDNEKFMDVTAKDPVGNAVIVGGKIDVKYLSRDENGKFPEIESSQIPIIIKKKY